MRILIGTRGGGGGTGLPPDAPPTGYLWLYDGNSNQYIVDSSNNYILVPTPFVPWA